GQQRDQVPIPTILPSPPQRNQRRREESRAILLQQLFHQPTGGGRLIRKIPNQFLQQFLHRQIAANRAAKLSDRREARETLRVAPAAANLCLRGKLLPPVSRMARCKECI